MNTIRRISAISLKKSILYMIFSISGLAMAFLFLPYLFSINSASAASSANCTSGLTLSSTNAYFSVGATNENGGFNYGFLTATVCTPSSSGYTLTMSAKNGETRLKNRNDGQKSYISSLASNTIVTSSLNPFPVNRWGWNYAYSLVDDHTDGVDGNTGYGTYKPIPTSDTTVQRSISGGESTAVIYFGVRANTEIVYGKYYGIVTFTAVDNSYALVDFATAFDFYGKETYASTGYYKMQDMEADICSAVAYSQSTTLVDSRDNKTYTVTKAGDGHCWMASNLALGGNSAINLTSTDTTIANNFTLPARNSNTSTWQATGTSNPSAEIYADLDGNNIAVRTAYNLTAATAGTFTGTDSAAGSICPKGWRLPTYAEFQAAESYKSDINPYGYIKVANAVYQHDDSAYSALRSSDGGAYTFGGAATDSDPAIGYAVRCISDSTSSPEPVRRNGETTDNFATQSFTSSFLPSQTQSNNNASDGATDPLGAETETELSEESLARIAHVEALIEALPSASDVSLDHANQIEEAIAAYEDLNEFEQSAIDNYLLLKYNAVVDAYNNLKANSPINGVLVGAGIAAAAVATGVIVFIAVNKKRDERYYGDE